MGSTACSPFSASRDLSNYLILHCHGVGIYGFLAGNTFKSCQYSPILVLVALHGKATLFIAINPRQTNKVLLRFGKSHQCADPEGDHGQSDRCPYSPMNILAVISFGIGALM